MGRTAAGHCPQDTDSDTEVRLQGVHWEVVSGGHRQRVKEAGPGRAPSWAVSRSLGLGQCRKELGGGDDPAGLPHVDQSLVRAVRGKEAWPRVRRWLHLKVNLGQNR